MATKRLVERATKKQRDSDDVVAVGEIELPPGKSQVVVWDSKCTGLGVVVGKHARTFVFDYRADGKKRRTTIGRHGERTDYRPGGRKGGDDLTWSVSLARSKADELRGQVRTGDDPGEEKRTRRQGVTLRDALEMHLQNRRNAEGRYRAIESMKRELEMYLEEWLDRPLKTITRQECRERHLEIGTDHGKSAANRAMRYFRAAFNTAADGHPELPACPTTTVAWYKVKSRKNPIPWDELPGVYKTMQGIAPVRRDFYMTLFLTGLRDRDAASLRWEHIDLEAGIAHRPAPKGGEDKAFDLPLSSQLVAILRERQAANARAGNDGGWCFPTTALKRKAYCYICDDLLGQPEHRKGQVVHLIQGIQRETVDGEKVTTLPSPHRWRYTYINAANELKLQPYDIKLLVNHALPKNDVTAGYLTEASDHLHECQQRVTDFLLSKAIPPKRKRAR